MLGLASDGRSCREPTVGGCSSFCSLRGSGKQRHCLHDLLRLKVPISNSREPNIERSWHPGINHDYHPSAAQSFLPSVPLNLALSVLSPLRMNLGKRYCEHLFLVLGPGLASPVLQSLHLEPSHTKSWQAEDASHCW